MAKNSTNAHGRNCLFAILTFIICSVLSCQDKPEFDWSKKAFENKTETKVGDESTPKAVQPAKISAPVFIPPKRIPKPTPLPKQRVTFPSVLIVPPEPEPTPAKEPPKSDAGDDVFNIGERRIIARADVPHRIGIASLSVAAASSLCVIILSTVLGTKNGGRDRGRSKDSRRNDGESPHCIEDPQGSTPSNGEPRRRVLRQWVFV